VDGALPPDNGLPPAFVEQPAQQGALGPYIRALKAHAWIVAIVMLAALIGSLAYLQHRATHYKATAEILFNPVPSNNQGAIGLPVLRESGDPTRLSQTAVSLLDTHRAAVAAAEMLGRGWSPGTVARDVSVQVQGQSDIIAVTAEASGAKDAQRLADTFATASLGARQTLLRQYASQPGEAAPRTTTEGLEGGSRRLNAENVIAQERQALLAEFAKGQDPNFSLAESAGLPTAPAGTASWLVVVLSLIAGFALASVAAVLIEMVSDRVRDADDLLGFYRLPVLAYVPALPRSVSPVKGQRPHPFSLAAINEAFRMVRVQLDTATERELEGARTILITSASEKDGKTSSATQIAKSLAEAGHRVALIDLDLRKPDLAVAAKATTPNATGITSLLGNDRKLSDVLTPTETAGLSVIPAGPGASAQLLQPLVSRLPSLIEELRETADYIVIDTAPLGEVGDAYQLLPFADDIIVVARINNTRRKSFQFMRDLLMRAHRTPRGILIIGEGTPHTSYYYAPELAQQTVVRRWLERARIAR
jgi:capsular exopolysaccharide synthesis family protein